MRSEIDKRAMATLSSGHLAVDFANGALPALLPFLVRRFDLSYTLAAVLMLASAASSSVIQPLFGLWSDRRGAIWLLLVMSQEYLPSRIGLASGLAIGLSIGLGGVAAVGLGAVADSIDLRTALVISAAAPVLAIALGAWLPSSRAPRQFAPEPVVP